MLSTLFDSVAPVIYVCFSPLCLLWYLTVIRHSMTSSVCVLKCQSDYVVEPPCEGDLGRQPYAKRECALLYSDVFAPCHNLVSVIELTHIHTQTSTQAECICRKVLPFLQQESRGWWGVMGTAPNWSQQIHCSSETNTQYCTRWKLNHRHTHNSSKCFNAAYFSKWPPDGAMDEHGHGPH